MWLALDLISSSAIDVACHADVSSDISDRHMLINSSSPPSVAIVNGVGYHTEVYTALLWSFQQAGASSTAFVEKDSNAGIQDAISDWCVLPHMILQITSYKFGDPQITAAASILHILGVRSIFESWQVLSLRP